MAISSYRFVSPGVQVQEIDNSQLPAISNLTGPTVIGRFEKGPTMRPVYITSFSQFVETFGNPIPGKLGNDVWRDGNYVGTTYAAYAAQAWLRNTPALNVIRLVGKQHSSPSANGKAGWKTDLSFATASVGGGAYGLFVVPSASAGSTVNGTLAAIWYIQSGSVQLTGAVAGASTQVQGANVLVQSQDVGATFRAVVTGPSGSYVSNFNFDPDSDFYIRKVFNTNPILTNLDITSTSSSETYWLGESFERSLKEVVPQVSGSTYGFIAPLTNGTINCDNFKMNSREAKTGWVIGQDLTTNTGSYVASAQQKLFRISTLDGGEYEQKNYKISITDVRAPLTDFDDYGTFTLSIRNAADSDNTPQYVERYSNVNLNPASPDYIAARIGDKFTQWDETERRLREYGTYDNVSKIIRIEMNDDVDAGNVDPTYLPFGFFGPPKFNSFTVTSGSTTTAPVNTPVTGGYGGVYNAGNFLYTAVDLTASVQFPSIPLRLSSSTGGLGDPRNAHFGITVGESVATTTFDATYYDLTRALPADIGETWDASGTYLTSSFVFSLDELSSSAGGVGFDYVAGCRASGNSYNGTTGYRNILNAGYNKFTMPLYGGFDGFDVTEAEPLRNGLMSDASTEKNSSVYYTYSRAIDTCADPESLVTDIVTVPGLTLTGLTNKLIQTCENRADALAIIDLPDVYTPEQEAKVTSKTSRYSGNVTTTAAALKARGLNSSYAATYYPWVQVRDTLSNRSVFVPPSVVALGAMSYGQATQELWFAPAGFTRGGLTEGRGGIPVIGVSQKLSSKERDTLYENNINPIASFPAEGIVIFGQKTLQVTPSALDRINVRRMMIYVKREISKIASRLLFDQNVEVTWSRFTGQVNPFLSTVKSRLGLTDYRVILDKSTTTTDLIDRNIMYAKIFLKPARSIEFIAIDFTVTDSGASFVD